MVLDFHDSLQIELSRLGDGVRTLDTAGMDFPGSWCGTMGDFLVAIEEDREPLVSARFGGKWVALA